MAAFLSLATRECIFPQELQSRTFHLSKNFLKLQTTGTFCKAQQHFSFWTCIWFSSAYFCSASHSCCLSMCGECPINQLCWRCWGLDFEKASEVLCHKEWGGLQTTQQHLPFTSNWLWKGLLYMPSRLFPFLLGWKNLTKETLWFPPLSFTMSCGRN